MSYLIKVNYLSKEELQYELSFQNVTMPSHMCVEPLRQLLREHINSVADVEFLSRKMDLHDEIKVTNAKLSIVSDVLDNSETESPLYVSRVIYKIN